MAEIEVPVISLKPWTSGGSAEEKAKVVDEIRDACERCGFLSIVDHGIPAETIKECWQQVREFFDKPEAFKKETDMTDDYPYGYNGIAAEKAGNELKDDYGSGDQKESWQACLGSVHPEEYGIPPVKWPRDSEEFKRAFTAYYRAIEGLSVTLLRIFALGLGLPEHWFEDKTDKHWCALRTLNYPHQEKPPAAGALRIAPHSDYGTLTILRADDAPGGLQVLKKDGSWMDVRMHPDSFVVNIGDLMQRWTNDRWMSTVHRVVNPPIDIASMRDTRRQSIAFFHNVNRDVTVSTIPTCVDDKHPAKYPPINAFEHLMERHARATGAAVSFSGKSM